MLVVVTVSTGVPAVILSVAYKYFWQLGLALESFWCYQILATKSLKVESDRVYIALKDKGLEAGRKAVSMIVGRDTQNLTEEGVTKAAVETVAENTSDGVIAPLFYMLIGGAVLGFTYKAINTMDSMVGYKNDKYQWFGTAAAKLDDVVNFIPARVSAVLMILAAYLTGMDGRLFPALDIVPCIIIFPAMLSTFHSLLQILLQSGNALLSVLHSYCSPGSTVRFSVPSHTALLFL